MRPELKPMLWIGAATLGVAVLVGLLRPREEFPAGSAESPSTAMPPGNVPSEHVLPAALVDAGPLPWQRSTSQNTQPEPTRLAVVTHGDEPMDRARLMATMQTQLQHNQIAADAALQRIDQLQTSGEVPEGVDLPALRENLLVAKQAQALAIELTRTHGEPDTPERERKIATIVTQLQEIQARLQQQMPAHPGGTPSPATRTR